MSDTTSGIDNPFDESPAPPPPAGTPTPSDVYNAPDQQSVKLEPGKPLTTGTEEKTADVENTPKFMPAPVAPEPTAPAPTPPDWLKPSPPMPFAPRPEMPAAPAATPQLDNEALKYKPVGLPPVQELNMPKPAEKGWDWGGIAGQFGQGLIKGPVKFASDADALGRALTGQLQTYEKGDWQLNALDTPAQQKDLAYQIGSGVGYTASSIGAAGAAALSLPFDVEAIGGAAVTALGGRAAAAIGVGTIGAAAEGALYGAGSGANEAQVEAMKTGKEPDYGEVAIGAGIGAVGGGVLGGSLTAAGVGIKQLWRNVMRNFHYNNLVRSRQYETAAGSARREQLKMLRGRIEAEADALAEETENMLFEQEAKQTIKAAEAMNPPPPDNALAAKQRQLMKESKKPKKLKAGKEETPPIAVVEEKPQGPTRKPIGNNIGFARIDLATPLDDVVKLLPPELGSQLHTAVTEIGKAKALFLHLQNQAEEYAVNGLSHAASPGDFNQIKRVATERLSSEKTRELDQLKAELFQAQGAEKARIEGEIATVKAEMDAQPTRSDVRKQLFAQYNRLLGALQEFGSKELLELSDAQHVHTVADRSNLSGATEKLAENFPDAVAQFDKAYGLMQNAEKHFDTVRKSYQPVFEKVDAALGQRTAVRAEISAPEGKMKLTGKTEMAVGLQFNPSLAKLVSKWKRQYQALEAQFKAGEENIRTHYMYESARKLRVTAPGAEKALSEAGFIPPHVHRMLAIGAGGLAALNPFHPAEAADLVPDVESMDEKQRHKYYGNLTAVGGIGLVAGAALLDRHFGSHGARIVIKGLKPFVHAMYGSVQDASAMADTMLGRTAAQNSLTVALNEWRGHLNQVFLRAKDEPALLLKKHHGETLTPAEEASISPQGKAWLIELQAIEKSVKKMLPDYLEEWKTHLDSLTDLDRHSQSEITACLTFVNDMLGPNPRKQEVNFFNRTIGQGYAGFCRGEFTTNAKIIGSCLIHDVLAHGGLKLGPKVTWNAYGIYASDPGIRALVGKIRFQGPRSEVMEEAAKHSITAAMAKEARSALGMKPAAPVPTNVNDSVLEQMHGEIIWLSSLLHQYHARQPELNALSPQFKPKDFKDFVQKVMTGNMPRATLDDTFMKASLDVTEMVGADPLHVNKIGPTRGYSVGNILAFNSAPAREARLFKLSGQAVKESVQGIINNTGTGNYGVAIMHAGRIAHALGVKATYAGGKAVIPVTAGAVLLNNPITSEATAQIMTVLNNYSLGENVVGDASPMVTWDPAVGPMMGRVAPGLQTTLDTADGFLHGFSEIGAMADVIGTKGPGELVAGSKSDETVKAGQNAVRSLMSLVMLRAATLGDLPYLKNVPMVNKIPLHTIRSALYRASNLFNDEHYGSVPAIPGISDNHRFAAEPGKVKYYDGEETGLAKMITDMTGITESQRDNLRQIFLETKSLREANYDIGVQAKSEDLKAASGLHD